MYSDHRCGGGTPRGLIRGPGHEVVLARIFYFWKPLMSKGLVFLGLGAAKDVEGGLEGAQGFAASGLRGRGMGTMGRFFKIGGGVIRLVFIQVVDVMPRLDGAPEVTCGGSAVRVRLSITSHKYLIELG